MSDEAKASMLGRNVGVRMWGRLLPVVLAPLIASCGSDGTTPPLVTRVLLTTTTTGEDIDADGYTYSVDGGPTGTIASNASAVAVTVLPGTRTISFAGIVGNCQAAGTRSVVVTVTAGESRDVEFHVTCEARARISTITSGEDVDVAFLVATDASPWRLLLPNTRLDLPGLTPGPHELRMAGVAPNCSVAEPFPHQITVPASGIVSVLLPVTCSATTRRILFGSTRDGGYNLYVMNADGTNTVRLTDGGTPALHGRWSPGGDKIAYHSPVAFVGADAKGFDIYVMNANGGGSIALTNDGSALVANLFPDWSPDGTKILFEKSGQIWLMNADGTGAHQVRTSGHNPRWSPDGNRIAFDDGSAVWVMGADGSNATIIQQVPNYYSAYPVWSPDGTKILFASPRDGAFTDIYVMNADGSGVVRLTRSPGGVANEQFDWSPDGKKIAFRTNRDGGNPEIYVMNADGSNPTRIAPNVWDEFGPAWHP